MKHILFTAFLLLVPSFSHAIPLINGNFEVGSFAGWSTIGDVSLVNSSFGVNPPQGHLQALMTTAPAEYCPNCYQHPQSYSGTNSSPHLTIFFGVSPWSPLGQAIEGSAIKQSFTANTGILLSFTWKYVTDESTLLDPAFFILDGSVYFLTPSMPYSSSPTPFAYEYGSLTSTFLILAGVHTIGFGIFDMADHHTNSGLLLDDISFRAVPEPATWLLVGIGLLAIIKTTHASKH